MASKLTLDSLRADAQRFDLAFDLPILETEPEAIHAAVSAAIANGDQRLDAIARWAQEDALPEFGDVVLALDDLSFELSLAANRVHLIKETSPQPTLREAATEAIKRFDEWAIGIDYREDVYRAVRRYAETQPELDGEDRKLFEETVRDYRRIGFDLPAETRAEVESLRKELSRLETDFQTHINEAAAELTYTREELAGAPEDFLNAPGVKTGENAYTLRPNLTWHAVIVMDQVASAEVRRAFNHTRLKLAKESNSALLDDILRLRGQIASQLGYATWADYRTETRMAQSGEKATAFIEQLANGLEAKFRDEVETLRKLKAEDTGVPDAQLELEDFRYYQNQLKKRRFDIDTEALRRFFPSGATLTGMFQVFERLFGLRIQEVENPEPWAPGVELYAVIDAESGEPLGGLYLDLYPREGKFNHFAQFGLIPGKQRRDGRYQRPIVALICNFPPPGDDRPSLLSHDETLTLFHEFGHALHSILTRARHNRYSGTGVDRDFVEVPSQLLEYWAWDPEITQEFARDYQNPDRSIDAAVLKRLKEAEKATSGAHYRRQSAFALIDLRLHSAGTDSQSVSAVERCNQILAEVFLPYPPDSAFAAYFGHLCGYDASYYGYAWSDAIAADLHENLRQAPNGLNDSHRGRELRRHIYEPGGSRDATELIEAFLGRPFSVEPFLREIGARSE